ncbi:hypothetical protein WICMUC_001265 [Wickerhamomyces mucosus]|uniref:Membrane anchor Opy2 N-terminal domain-containing protein n=1 Tax=Wickerhamomyces mucosus TaxID=1378264 RepID=A0A9P8THQ4_9ASCO|nr:hypothetical protein WICMUC_001265 [Wickerhamomyces mucosus]
MSQTLVSQATVSSLFPRATDSNGCIVCSDVPDCPSCPAGKSCSLTIQSCTECSTAYCSANSSGILSKASIGGLAGGIIGGIIILLFLGFLFYRYYLKKRIAFNRIHQTKDYSEFEDIDMEFHHNILREEAMEKPSTRTSIATTIFTRASNIIPIAYIPGVTIGTGTNSRASTYSYNTYNSEIAGDRYSKASIVGNPMLTTTAIRAKPKLISVDSKSPANSYTPHTAVSAIQLGGVKSVKVEKKKNFQVHDDVIEEEDEEYEEDKPKQNDEYDPFIIDDEGDDNDSDEEYDVRSKFSTGSVLLDVEVDTNSPFEEHHDNPK